MVSTRPRVYIGLDNVLMDITARLAVPADAGSIRRDRLSFSASIRPSSAEFLRQLAEDFDIFVISTFDETLMVELLQSTDLMRFITGTVSFRIDGFSPKRKNDVTSFILVDALDVFKRDIQVAMDLLHPTDIARIEMSDYLDLIAKHYIRCQFFFAGDEDTQPLTTLIPAIRQRLALLPK